MKFINLPRKLNQEFYRKCRQDFLKICAKDKNIVSVYEAGTVSQPGISDLDFVLCLKDKISGNFDIESKLSDDLKYIIGSGSILKLNESNFADINLIDNFNMIHLAGKKFNFKQYNNKFFELCRVMDWLPERIFTLLNLKKFSETDVWKGLQILKSFGVVLNSIDSLLGKSNFSFFINKVEKLRNGWFENEDNLFDFEKIIGESLGIATEAAGEMDSYLREKGFILPDTGGERDISEVSIPFGPRFLFGDGNLPYSFFYFLAAQALISKGFLSKQLEKAFRRELTPIDFSGLINEELLKTIRVRMDYCNNLADWFIKNNFKSGLLKYGWFLKNK